MDAFGAALYPRADSGKNPRNGRAGRAVPKKKRENCGLDAPAAAAAAATV